MEHQQQPNKKQVAIVFGATGKQGRSVARGLHHDYHVVGTTRCLEGDKAAATTAEFPEIEMMCCDLTKPEQVRAVFKAHPNAAAAFLVTNYYDESMQGDGVEEKAAVECARLAHEFGCKVFFFSTLPNVDAISQGKLKVPSFTGKARAVEQIKEIKGLRSIFLELGFYYQNFASYTPVKEEGDTTVFELPLSAQTKLHAFDVSQLGQLVAMILNHPHAYTHKVVPVWGDALTGDEWAAAYTEVTGKKAVFRTIPADELRETLSRARSKDDIHGMWQFVSEFGWMGLSKEKPDDASRALGFLRHHWPNFHPRSFREWLKESKWQGQLQLPIARGMRAMNEVVPEKASAAAAPAETGKVRELEQAQQQQGGKPANIA